MITRMISDEELVKATALVREAMISSLPEPQDCTGEFSEQFEERIKKLKKTTARKANWRKFAKGVVAAMLFVLISFSMLLAFSTETRAAVKLWFKESFGSYTTYWFTETEVKAIPTYELTWIPEGYEKISDESYEHMRGMVYQKGDNIAEAFVFDYSLTDDSSILVVESPYGEQIVESVEVWGTHGELYLPAGPGDSCTLLWFDEPNSVMLSINALLKPDDVLRLANSVQIVEQP